MITSHLTNRFVDEIDPLGDVMGAAGRPPADEENMSTSANKFATAHRLLPMCAPYVVVLMLGLPAGIALADSPPKLNVAPSCDAAARGAISAGRDKEACLVDERTAELSGQAVAKIAELAEVGADRGGVVRIGRDGHEAAEFEIGEGGDAFGEGGQIGFADAEFCGGVADSKFGFRLAQFRPACFEIGGCLHNFERVVDDD